MKTETPRALRRHHVQRVKTLCLRQVKFRFPDSREHWPEQVNHLYRNRHKCSCDKCRNPRRNPRRNGWVRRKDRTTMQEKRAALRANDFGISNKDS